MLLRHVEKRFFFICLEGERGEGPPQNLQLRIKFLIAALSEFKINVLHLHLTDTASWPVEIEGYPEMTQALSYRDINGNPLTYSRSDIREMVECHGGRTLWQAVLVECLAQRNFTTDHELG